MHLCLCLSSYFICDTIFCYIDYFVFILNIIDTVKKTGAKVSGPVPMPTKIERVTILRAVHKYKDSREQFEQRTHKRLIDVIQPTRYDKW